MTIYRVRVGYTDVYVRASDPDAATELARNWIAGVGVLSIKDPDPDCPVRELQVIFDPWLDTTPEVTEA